MPEPSSAVRLCLQYVFEPEPEAHDRVRNNPLYRALEDGIAGVHELLSVVLVARHAEHAELDAIVIDTAPSRHALDFVTYPGRLAFLLEGRPMAWLAGRAHGAKGDERGLLAWGKRRAEAAFDRLLGPRLRGDLAQIFLDLSLVRERFAAVTRRAEALLLGEQTRFVLVAAPTGAALADVLYLDKRLHKLGRRPAALVLNRADPAGTSWTKALVESPSATEAMRHAATILEQERAGRTARGDRFARDARRKIAAPIVRLSNVDAPSPVDVVRGLAEQIARELSVVAGSLGR
jgi:anion-transporting  ArsA/GET3 family ATPase